MEGSEDLLREGDKVFVHKNRLNSSIAALCIELPHDSMHMVFSQ